MQTLRHSRLFAAAAAGAVSLTMTALPAVAQDNDGETEVTEVRGHASGLFVDLYEVYGPMDFSFVFGPTPEAVLPPEGGGPFTDYLAEAIPSSSEGEIGVVAHDLEVGAEGELGPEGFAESFAALAIDFDEMVSADLLETECRSDLAEGHTGSTTILGGLVTPPGEDDPSPIQENPDPDTVLVDLEFEDSDDEFLDVYSMHVVVNEHTVTDNDITVTGLRISVQIQRFEGDNLVTDSLLQIRAAESSCGLDASTTEATEPTVPADEVVAPLDEALAVATPRFTG